MKKNAAMPQVLIQETHNLLEWPEQVRTHISDDPTKQKRITIGDLHGNPLKLLWFLIKEGVVVIDRQAYEEIARLYTDLPNRENGTGFSEKIGVLKRIAEYLEEIEVVPNSPLVTLLGDVFGDRGENDYLTMFLLKILHQQQTYFEIISSNHDLFWMAYYQADFSQVDSLCSVNMQGQSLIHFHDFRQDLEVRSKDLRNFFTEVYFPHLRLVSFDIDENNLNIYSHAGINDHNGSISESIIRMLHFLRQEEDYPHAEPYSGAIYELSDEDIIRSIEEMNSLFAEKIQEKAINVKNIWRNNDHPLHAIHWMRQQERPNTQAQEIAFERARSYFHGHDKICIHSSEKTLDQDWGKYNEAEYHRVNQGYVMVVSDRADMDFSMTNPSTDGSSEEEISFVPYEPVAAPRIKPKSR